MIILKNKHYLRKCLLYNFIVSGEQICTLNEKCDKSSTCHYNCLLNTTKYIFRCYLSKSLIKYLIYCLPIYGIPHYLNSETKWVWTYFQKYTFALCSLALYSLNSLTEEPNRYE